MANQFCRYLSNGLSFSARQNEVMVSPCCWFGKQIPLDSQFQSNYKNAVDSVNGWTDACSACKVLEDAGQQSLRQTGPDWIHGDAPHGDPVCIDINLDINCNAACVTCGADSSSLWKIENAKLLGKKIKLELYDDTVNKSISKILESVSLDQVRYVKFYGGEPLFTDTHLKFIKHIPYPEQVTLHYTTNGSIYPNDKVLASWKNFKTIIFAASLDGIKEQFDYVRWPLPWHKVSKNLIRLRENKDIWNLMFRVEFTANFLNVYYFDRLEDWIKNNLDINLSGDKTEINVHPCWGIWELVKMPYNIREAVLKKYPVNHVIHRLVANLPEPTPLLPWQQFVNTWDTRRNNSWQTAFPELARYI